MEDIEKHTLYAIFLDKVTDVTTTQDTINRHINYLKQLHSTDRLVLCGPFADYPSGLVVVRTKSKDDAISIAKNDPFVTDGVRSYQVRTWIQATPENNFLGT